MTSGQQTALAGVTSTQLVTLLLYVVHFFGINDMTPEVAASIVGLATAVAGAVMHRVERHERPRNQRAEDQA